MVEQIKKYTGLAVEEAAVNNQFFKYPPAIGTRFYSVTDAAEYVWNGSTWVAYTPLVKNQNEVWDAGSLTWVAMTQPGGGSGGAVTIVNGGDIAEGNTADAAIVTDAVGTVSGKLRGLVKILASVWNSVSGRLNVETLITDIAASGNLTALNSAVTIALSGQSSLSFEITGSWSGSVKLQASVDGTNWSDIVFFKSGFDTGVVDHTTLNGQYRALSPAAFSKVRAIMAAYSTGTATVSINASLATQETDFGGASVSSNSTSTPLGNGATFTGEYVDTVRYESIAIQVSTDKPGILYLDMSGDDVNTDETHTYNFDVGGIEIIHPAHIRYVRIRIYNNSGTGQTYLRASMLLKDTMSTEVLELEQEVMADNYASIARSLILARKPDLTYSNIGQSQAGNLKVSIEEQAISLTTVPVITTGAKSAIGGTALQLTASSIAAYKGVLVKASKTNTGVVYIGKSTVTAGTADATDGVELYPGDAIMVEIDNISKIYAISSSTGQKVYWAVL